MGDLGLNFPGYDATAAKYLTVERGVLGVGTDAISIDAGVNSRVRRFIYICCHVIEILKKEGFEICEQEIHETASIFRRGPNECIS